MTLSGNTMQIHPLTWLLIILLLISGCGGGGSSNSNSTNVTPPPMPPVTELTVASVTTQNWPTMPLQVVKLSPSTGATSAPPFTGTISAPQSRLHTDAEIHNFDGGHADVLPAFSVQVFTEGNKLIPVSNPQIGSRPPQSLWQIIFGGGSVWQEPTDEGYSRGQLTVTLVNPFYANAHNGLLTFLYRDNEITDAWLQIFQENVDWLKQDYWGPIALQLSQANINWVAEARVAYRQLNDEKLPQKPWSELTANVAQSLLDNYHSGIDGANLSGSGLYYEGDLYYQPTETRYGTFPYPDSMRHGVYSVAKSMAAAVALFHLNHRYPDELTDARLVDYIEGLHAGWQDVTLAQVLSMATGTGTANPSRQAQDPFADETFEDDSLLTGFSLARSHQEKLHITRQFGDYPWAAGEVVRYNTSYTYLLSVALDNFLLSKGEERPLWQVLQEDVYRKLGIRHFKMMHTEENTSQRPYPIMGVGIYPTAEEAIKIALLFQQGGLWQGERLLDANLVSQVTQFTEQTGLPAEIDGQANVGRRYHLSFWAQAFELSPDCHIVTPFMLGYGANYVILPGNDTILYRFQDAFNTDKLAMLRVADALSPFCE